MNANVTIFVDGTPYVSYKWPVVPNVGDTIILDVNTYPQDRQVVVMNRVFYKSNLGDCQVDLECELRP